MGWVMLWKFNATFNNILEISFIGEGGRTIIPTKTHQPKYSSLWVDIELTTLVVIDTDCIEGCKTNFNKIMAMCTKTPQKIY
jgi:hypothetical protein